MTKKSERATAFAEYLNFALRALKWNGSDLAQRLEISPTTVNRWRNAERLPNPWYSRRIAEVMGLEEREVMVRAGHLDPTPLDEDPVRTEMHDLVDSIPVDQLRPMVGVLRAMVPGRDNDVE